jgi:UDP-N-acetylmuramyl pentapeptide phosphotransferase/UDP-N-acetylglucosamine-1-phosphate transferase
MLDGAMVAAVGLGFALSLFACVAIVRTQGWHGRFTHDAFTGVQKFHSRPTPRIGGAGIALGYWLVWPALPAELRPIWGQIGLAATPALVAGLVEDITKRVPTRVRLFATKGAGLLFAVLTGYTMHQVHLPGVDWLLSFSVGALLFTAFSMGGVANAVNIIDGFHGLAAGACLIMLGGFAYVGLRVGDELVVALALLYAALIAGFFVVNFPFGRIFLGDGGAYFCGFLLASLGVLLPMRNPEVSAWAAILICAYPVIETLASMRRKARREGCSIGEPDRLHFHMLAHRRYGRRLVPRHLPADLRNPATSVVTWLLPLATTAMVAVSYDSVVLSAAFFFLTVYLYGQAYAAMSLNAPRMPVGIARLF